jgi:hypothetical protein
MKLPQTDRGEMKVVSVDELVAGRLRSRHGISS